MRPKNANIIEWKFIYVFHIKHFTTDTNNLLALATAVTVFSLKAEQVGQSHDMTKR